jgi:hypothetical protein
VSAAFRNLYVLRAAMASCWIALVTALDAGMPVGSAGGFRLGAEALLAAYPLLDGLGTVIDLRLGAGGRLALAQRVNLALDLVAAAAVGVAAASVVATMDVLAVWAVLAGLLQVLIGAGRVGRLSGQWPMILSGLGSIVGGGAFLDWQLSALAAMDRLVEYSIGGTVLYLVAALTLLFAGVGSRPRLNRGDAGPVS